MWDVATWNKVMKSHTMFTWKCGDDTHLASCLNNGSITFWNSAGSITSKISSSSFKNITSLGECVFGQNFSRFLITGSVNDGSFSKNWTTQYANCGWYTDNDLALCKGNRTFNRNTLCSSFNGRAKPLIILKGNKTLMRTFLYYYFMFLFTDILFTCN